MAGPCSVLLAVQIALVEPETAHDAAPHRLHRAVHVLVGLEDPAHLALLLRRHLGRVEMALVEARGDARVLPLRLDAEREHAYPVDLAPVPEELRPSDRQ